MADEGVCSKMIFVKHNKSIFLAVLLCGVTLYPYSHIYWQRDKEIKIHRDTQGNVTGVDVKITAMVAPVIDGVRCDDHVMGYKINTQFKAAANIPNMKSSTIIPQKIDFKIPEFGASSQTTTTQQNKSDNSKSQTGIPVIYGDEKAPSTPGPTRGSAYVTEYDPVRGLVRSWYESRTHAGLVNRVHPKMINGKNIKSLHYPHTKAELEAIAQQIKGKNNVYKATVW